MTNLLLYLHVASGVLSIIGAASGLHKSLEPAGALYKPGLASVSASGVLLMITGAGLGRTCLSATVFLLSVLALRRISARQLSLDK